MEDYARYFDSRFPLWMQIDWLLVGIFLFMSILITIGADLRKDAILVVVGLIGGFLIESWGTHTGLWAYYTGEKPPLWILPAWPIAALAIERMARLAGIIRLRISEQLEKALYTLVFGGFIIYMLAFIRPTLAHPFTILAFAGVMIVSLSSGNRRYDLVTFISGAALGYFLETWGTTRECWTYYTLQKPPFFAILAHGLASVAFWRLTKLGESILKVLVLKVLNRQYNNPAHR
ncbi:MAG: hypothetical protein C0391_02025 [Anaerolinea sp.]|nr:hypothetical protein [Anaerolinea sp.]